MRDASCVAGEDSAVLRSCYVANYGDEVIHLSPTLLVCYVWFVVDGDPLCVLSKFEE
jgi:hypothetical protein